ncbi:rhomboid family intramembrane serine protease [Companilactobacillus sp. RD055328]|uniref:rhomboid family intramembrane serine protease n=1 Tax=Companilactobacillus sp. RD055328 TaxID=2916634 RepID=UPI001FC8767D|nr:rhomboid family intramembrane serine protease [Companilactobacillus sp. RD055328]GKQ42536.1 rhomboid family intramembrane serine protease [Companilactobacillus sp. RD055328]
MYSKYKSAPIVTYVLLAIQIIVFLLETINGGSTNFNTLIYYGAKANALVINGDWWRLITPMFVHIGFTHILLNSLTLYYAGSQLEGIFGHFKYFIIYFVSGILGNLFSFSFGSDLSISAGASTALFGLFASYIALAYLNKSNQYMRAIGNQFMMLIVLNIVMDLFMTQIDIWGHLGGAIGGLLATFIISKKFSENENILFRIGSSLLLLILVVFLYSQGMGA